MKKRFFSLVLLGVLFLGAFVCLHADVGNFNSYSGTTGWRSQPSTRSGSVHMKRRHYSKQAQKRRGSSSERPIRASDVIFLVIFAIAGVYSVVIKLLCGPSYWGVRKVDWGDERDTVPVTSLTPLPNHNEAIALALSETDHNFNLYDFLTWTKEVFLKLQLAWMKRDWESVRTFESDTLFTEHEAQIKEYERLGRINVLDRININNAYLFLFRQEKTVEYVAVFLQVRMIDYIIDERSGAVLKGSADKDCFLSYLYVFKRARGITTPEEGMQAETVACPHCGAPIRVGSAGRCEYCDFVVLVKNHGWVLDDIIGVKPPYSTYGPGGVRKYKDNGGNTYGTHSSH